jgi:hypothetical protein
VCYNRLKRQNRVEEDDQSLRACTRLKCKFQREDSEFTRRGNPDLGDKIVDARPFVNALGNALTGKGFERE